MINDKNWYVVKTKPNQEFRAIKNLINQGFETFCPLLPLVKKNNNIIKKKMKPLFPSYIFSLFDVKDQRWTSIESTYGVQYLLKNERMYPQTISKDFIGSLKQNCNEQNCISNNYFKLTKDDNVQFIDGPFINSIGKIIKLSSSERVSVLFEIFNNQYKIDVQSSILLKV